MVKPMQSEDRIPSTNKIYPKTKHSWEELHNFPEKAIPLVSYQQQPITSLSKQKIVTIVAPNMDNYAQHLVSNAVMWKTKPLCMSMSIILSVIFV